jgi:hypothetical protein
LSSQDIKLLRKIVRQRFDRASVIRQNCERLGNVWCSLPEQTLGLLQLSAITGPCPSPSKGHIADPALHPEEDAKITAMDYQWSE